MVEIFFGLLVLFIVYAGMIWVVEHIILALFERILQKRATIQVKFVAFLLSLFIAVISFGPFIDFVYNLLS